MRSRESGGLLGITPFPLQPRSLGPLPKGRLLALKPVLENKCIPRPSNAFLYNSYTLVTPTFDLKFPQFKSPARGGGGGVRAPHPIPFLSWGTPPMNLTPMTPMAAVAGRPEF